MVWLCAYDNNFISIESVAIDGQLDTVNNHNYNSYFSFCLFLVNKFFGQEIFSSRHDLKCRKSVKITFCQGSRFNVATILVQFVLVFLINQSKMITIVRWSSNSLVPCINYFLHSLLYMLIPHICHFFYTGKIFGE